MYLGLPAWHLAERTQFPFFDQKRGSTAFNPSLTTMEIPVRGVLARVNQMLGPEEFSLFLEDDSGISYEVLNCEVGSYVGRKIEEKKYKDKNGYLISGGSLPSVADIEYVIDQSSLWRREKSLNRFTGAYISSRTWKEGKNPASQKGASRKGASLELDDSGRNLYTFSVDEIYQIRNHSNNLQKFDVVYIRLAGQYIKALIDSGASECAITEELYSKCETKLCVQLSSVGKDDDFDTAAGDKMRCSGSVKLTIFVGSGGRNRGPPTLNNNSTFPRSVSASFYVFKSLTCDMILTKHKAEEMRLDEDGRIKQEPFSKRIIAPTERIASRAHTKRPSTVQAQAEDAQRQAQGTTGQAADQRRLEDRRNAEALLPTCEHSNCTKTQKLQKVVITKHFCKSHIPS